MIETDRSETTRGLLAASSAYMLWGFMPVYFKLVQAVSPWVILGHRVIWAVPVVLAMLAVSGRLREISEAIRQPKVVFPLLVSAVLIASNWGVYIWAVVSERILEASLGYFINPLMTLALAALLFGERFSRLQMLAVAIAALGVLNQTIVVGQVPWVSLALGALFALYSAIRKVTPVTSRTGLAIETLWLTPFALVGLMAFPVAGSAALGAPDWPHFLLLMLAGPVTAMPLILFAIGARALQLSTIGILQFSAPTLQFVLALAYGETFTAAHAVTFGLIWIGVGLYCFSALRREKLARRAAA